MKTIDVHIGQVKVGRGETELRALLGSCVGIGLFWDKRRVYGLAHCLLPKAHTTSFEIGARFVTQAVPSLMALMKIRSADVKDVRAVLAGGGKMMSPGVVQSAALVGEHNAQAAVEELTKRGIRIDHADFGGDEGRRLIVCCTDGTYRVEKIPKLEEAI